MNGQLETFIPLSLKQRGIQKLTVTAAPAYDTELLEGLGRAFYWKSLLDSGTLKSGSDIALQEGLHHSTVNELLRLTLLAPDIVERMLAGRQPRMLTLMWFQRHRLPVDWQAQRDILSRFE